MSKKIDWMSEPALTYFDTTVGCIIVWAGAKTGWLHGVTGASV